VIVLFGDSMGVDLLRKFTTSYAGFTYFRLNATRETNIARVGTIEEKRPDASFGISIEIGKERGEESRFCI